MSLLQMFSTPAERRRGASWADRFESAALVARNGGAVTGAPTFSPDGVVLDGTSDSITYNLTGQEFDSAGIAIVCAFTPHFAPTENVNRSLFDTTAGSRYMVRKTDNGTSNAILIYLGNTFIASIAEATYSPYWLQDEQNILVVSGTTGDTSVWLNGVLMVDADSSAWSAKTPALLYLGTDVAGNEFDGAIHRLQVYKSQLSDDECIDLSTDAVYAYRDTSTLVLPFGAAEHDPTSVRSLDLSGNGAHAVFGDGSTPTTYPGKIARHHGYDYDGGDYLVVPATGLLNSNLLTIALEFWPDFETGEDANRYLLDATATARYGISKRNNAATNTLVLYLGNTNIGSIAEATYSPFWRRGHRNLLIITGDSVNNLTNVWLNEGQIMTNDATAWVPANPSSFYIGSAYDASSKFSGGVNHLEIFTSLLTAMQREDLSIRLARRVNRT